MTALQIVLIGWSLISPVLCYWVASKAINEIRVWARTEVEIIHELRLTMEDLRRRDPQLEEVLEVALADMVVHERNTKLIASGAGMWALLTQLRQPHRKPA